MTRALEKILGMRGHHYGGLLNLGVLSFGVDLVHLGHLDRLEELVDLIRVSTRGDGVHDRGDLFHGA